MNWWKLSPFWAWFHCPEVICFLSASISVALSNVRSLEDPPRSRRSGSHLELREDADGQHGQSKCGNLAIESWLILNDIHHLSISFNFLLIFGKRCWKLPVVPKETFLNLVFRELFDSRPAFRTLSHVQYPQGNIFPCRGTDLQPCPENTQQLTFYRCKNRAEVILLMTCALECLGAKFHPKNIQDKFTACCS